MSNDASGSHMPATLRLRLSGGHADMWTIHCFKFVQVCVIPMHPGDIGCKADGRKATFLSGPYSDMYIKFI